MILLMISRTEALLIGKMFSVLVAIRFGSWDCGCSSECGYFTLSPGQKVFWNGICPAEAACRVCQGRSCFGRSPADWGDLDGVDP